MNEMYPGYSLERFHGKCPCEIMTHEKLGYFEWYDAFFCKACRHWLSPKCGYPDCPDCSQRPDLVPVFDVGGFTLVEIQSSIDKGTASTLVHIGIPDDSP